MVRMSSRKHTVFFVALLCSAAWAVAGSALLQVAILLHPWSRDIFKAALLGPEHWLLALGVGLLPLIAMEGWKAVKR